ncbi:MAG: endonuclease/exonuclease/phosphatase family protein [Rhodothermales bacterium]
MIRRFVRTALLLLDGLLLLLFLVGYLARYIHPRYAWWAGLIATGLPYISGVLAGATVGILLARRWKWLALHLLVLVLILVRFVSMEGGASPGPGDLRVMTFNTSRGGGASVEELGRAVTAVVRAEKPDLLALQEAYIEYHPTPPTVRPEPILAALIDSLGYRTIGPDGSRGATYTPQPVLGRMQLLEQTQTIVEQGDDNTPTARVMRTRFRWKGREAVHYNLHLLSFGYQKPWEDEQRDLLSLRFWITYLRQYRDAYLTRARQVEKIRALLDQETLPVIVSGDFNSTPHNWVYYCLTDGLQDAFKVAGRGWGATYHVKWPVARIDHLLVSPEWKVVSAHVSEAPHSDHLPLVVQVRWRE